MTEIEVPEPMDAPVPHTSSYHTQLAPLPRLPPLSVNVTAPPEQIWLPAALLVIEVAAVDKDLTVTVTDLQMVLLQSPSART